MSMAVLYHSTYRLNARYFSMPTGIPVAIRDKLATDYDEAIVNMIDHLDEQGFYYDDFSALGGLYAQGDDEVRELMMNAAWEDLCGMFKDARQEQNRLLSDARNTITARLEDIKEGTPTFQDFIDELNHIDQMAAQPMDLNADRCWAPATGE